MKRTISFVLLTLLVIGAITGICSTPAFAWTAVYNPSALDNTLDLITPSAAQKYPLGSEIKIYDSARKSIKTYIYVKAAGSALTIYNAYVIRPSSATGAEYKIALATQTWIATATASVPGKPEQVGVAPAAFTANYYGFLQTEGYCTVAVTTNTTAGNMLSVASGASNTKLSDEATTTMSMYTIGVAKAARYGVGNIAAVLVNRRAQIK